MALWLIPMSLLSASQIAIGILFNNIQWLVLGVIIGMFFGVIPGMGGTVTISILLPFTLGMDQYAAFTVLAAVLGAVSFSGSISAILVNAPGTGGNAATLLDGYPMTRKGESARAIGISATASAAGAIVGLLFFFLLIPVVVKVALLFGPSEIFWMVIFGIGIIPLVAGEHVLAGIAMGGVGLMLAFIGQASATGEFRFTFGLPILFDGIGIIPPIVGLFAIAEMLRLASTGSDIVQKDNADNVDITGSRFDGVRDVITHRWLWLRCSIIGLIVGIVPGVGASVATFVAYGHAVSSSNNPEEFGSGRPEGIIASEAANDAKDGGQLFPTLGLGIPGSSSTAVLLGGFIIHGILPGPNMLTDQLPLMLVIVFSLLFSNILTSAIGLIFTSVFTVITKISITRLFPSIVIISLVAVFVLRNTYADLFFAAFFGILGLILMYLNISRIPVIIAIVLGKILEDNYHLAVQIDDGVWNALFGGWLDLILVSLLIVTFAAFFFTNIRKVATD